jgi:DNA-binding response OmpR family regulator
MHICLVDDDPRLLATLRQGFVELGHECETFQSAPEGLARLLDRSVPEPDVVLLDVLMPELDGWTLLARLRAAGRRVPVLFLTAKRDVDDRVRGLEASADDYVVKPFAFKELLARLDAVLRRRGHREPLHHGDLVVHHNRPRVEYAGRAIEVTLREHAFLELLAEQPGHVFPRQELLKRLWEIDFDPQTNMVEVFVARLRRKLGPDGARLVETVVREGYRLRELPA